MTTKIHSVWFNKPKWNRPRSEKWLEDNGITPIERYKHKKIKKIVYIITDDGNCKEFRSYKIPKKGIELIMCK